MGQLRGIAESIARSIAHRRVGSEERRVGEEFGEEEMLGRDLFGGGKKKGTKKGMRRGAIRADEIPTIVENSIGHSAGEYNLYPGVPGSGCHPLAIFVSLEDRGNLKFALALETLVRHLQGICPKTQKAVLLTENWVKSDFDKWKDNIRRIKDTGCHLEAYLLMDGCVSETEI